MAAALGYAQTRTGDIAYAVRTDRMFHAYRQDHLEWSASVLKAKLLVAYVDRPSVAGQCAQQIRRVPAVPDDHALRQPRRERRSTHIVGNAGLDAWPAGWG